MAKINTTNYQPVTAWNGTQDLLVVEQPDGTKVATPEQVKQFMDAFMDDEPTEGSEEAVKSGGIFNAIENSVSLKNATGNPITLTDAANTNAEKLVMTIEPTQSGSGDPSPTNVRPISGLTEGKVIRTGKNLLENVTPTETTGGITYTLNDDGSVTCSGTYSEPSHHVIGRMTLPAGTYILSGCPERGAENGYSLRMSIYSSDAWLGTDRGAGATITLSQPTDAIVRIYVYSNNVVGKTFYPMLRLATETDPTFEPYTGASATITFGQTVYGGSVNFKTGEVTVTHGFADMGTLNWNKTTTSGAHWEFISNSLSTLAKFPTRAGITNTIKCSIYTEESVDDLYHGTIGIGLNIAAYKQLIVCDETYSDAASFKTAMSGVQLCYELATPTTLTLTPAELELLKGNNTITANGAEISIEYYPNNAIGALAERVDGLTTPTLIWNGYATDVGSTYSMTRNYTDFKYLLVTAKTNYEEKNILIPTSGISATDIYGDVLSTGAWNANTNAFTYNSSYGIKFTAANAFQLVSSYYNNANWVLKPIAIYGIG